MHYLKKLKINKIKNIIFLKITFFLFIFINNISANENKIIFKINNVSFTSVDLENRKTYLNFIGDNLNLSENEIIKDYVSVNLFYNYFKYAQLNYNLKEKIDEIYLNILNERKKNNLRFSII